MFGHDDKQEDDKDVQINDELLQPEDQSDEHQDSSDSQPQEGGAVEIAPSAPPTDDNASDDQQLSDDSSDEPSDEHSEEASEPAPEEVAAPEPEQQIEPEAPAPAATNSPLLDIKQQALQSLSPLLGHLDQTPEEKFRTTMMLIQASDNQDLVKVAFEAAQSMTDEKARAQALLDIVNEINYFTQKEAQA